MTRSVVSATVQARRDVQEIAAYIAGDNPAAAIQFAGAFSDALRRIADHPAVGHRLSGYGGSVLVTRVSRRFARYLILYRQINTGELEVVRVLHGARDLPTLLP